MTSMRSIWVRWPVNTNRASTSISASRWRAENGAARCQFIVVPGAGTGIGLFNMGTSGVSQFERRRLGLGLLRSVFPGGSVIEILDALVGELLWRAIKHNAAIAHADNAIAKLAGEVNLMEATQHGGAAFLRCVANQH